MTDHFDAWINSMSDDEYSDMLDESNPFGFSDKQEEKALNIREPPKKEEQEDLDAMQSFTEQEDIQEPERAEPVKVIREETFTSTPIRTTTISESGIRVEQTGERVTMVREPISTPPPIQDRAPNIVAPPKVEPTPPPKRPSRIARIRESIFGFARRFFGR